MNIVFTGTRKVYDEDFILGGLHFYRFDLKKIKNVFVGCAAGVDKSVRELFSGNDVNLRIFRADWKKYGNVAGTKRNEEMLFAAKKEFSVFGCEVIGYPCAESKGTIHCLVLAHEMGFRTYSYTHQFHKKYLERWRREKDLGFVC